LHSHDMPQSVTAAAGPGLSPWELDGDWRHTEGWIGPEGCIEGTDRPLTGVLFGYLDIVAGCPPSGPINPTVDLQVRLFSQPRQGPIRFTARTLRQGRSLYVAEIEMRHAPDEQPFGVGLATFVNRPMSVVDRTARGAGSSGESEGDIPGGEGDVDVEDRRSAPLTGTRRLRPGCLELDASEISNHPHRTVSGATLGRFIEQATMDLFGGAARVDELDVRFLDRVKIGPIRATATSLGGRGPTTTVRVEVVDAGHQDRLVTYGLAGCSALDRGSI
jgi:acyl-coenzyme A thioesterase PaaI-like protein